MLRRTRTETLLDGIFAMLLLDECQIPSAISTVLGMQSLASQKILERALWIRRFVLNLVRFWQDNCFKGIQSIAAILCGLERKRCDGVLCIASRSASCRSGPLL